MADSPSPPNEMADLPSLPSKTIEEKRKSSIFRRSAKSKNIEENTEMDGVRNLLEKPHKNKQSLKKKKENFLNNLLKDEEQKTKDEEEDSLPLVNNSSINNFPCGEKNAEPALTGESQNTGEHDEPPAVAEDKKIRKKSFIKRIIEYKKLMKDQLKEEKESDEANKKKDLQNDFVYKTTDETKSSIQSSDCLNENTSADCNPIPDCSEDLFQDALENVEEDCNTKRFVINETIEHDNENIFQEKEVKRCSQSSLILDEFDIKHTAHDISTVSVDVDLSTVSEITTITLTQTDIEVDVPNNEKIELVESNRNLSKCNLNDVCLSDHQFSDHQLVDQTSLATNEHETETNHKIVNITQVSKNSEEKLLNKNEFSVTCESITLTPIKSSTLNYVVVDKPPEGSKIDESFFAKKALKVYQKANLSRTYCQTCCSVM